MTKEQTLSEIEEELRKEIPGKYSLEYYQDMWKIVKKAIKLTIRKMEQEKEKPDMADIVGVKHPAQLGQI